MILIKTKYSKILKVDALILYEAVLVPNLSENFLFLSRSNEKLSRSNEKLSRSNEKLSRSNEKLSRSNEKLSRSNEKIISF